MNLKEQEIYAVHDLAVAIEKLSKNNGLEELARTIQHKQRSESEYIQCSGANPDEQPLTPVNAQVYKEGYAPRCPRYKEGDCVMTKKTSARKNTVGPCPYINRSYVNQ